MHIIQWSDRLEGTTIGRRHVPALDPDQPRISLALRRERVLVDKDLLQIPPDLLQTLRPRIPLQDVVAPGAELFNRLSYLIFSLERMKNVLLPDKPTESLSVGFFHGLTYPLSVCR